MKLALFCGLNGVDPARYNGWPGELMGCCSDARDLSARFAQYGYESRAFLDNDASLARFRTALNELAAAAKSGDSVIIGFSGHGGRSGPWTFTSYTEFLCFWDGTLADTELRKMLAGFREGTNVTVILDACYSGGMDRAGLPLFNARARYCPHFVSAKTVPPQGVEDKSAPIVASVLLLTACRADEVALDGFSNGMFTGSLLRAREEEYPGAHVPTWSQLFDETARSLRIESPNQHPQAIRLGPDRVFNQRLTT